MHIPALLFAVVAAVLFALAARPVASRVILMAAGLACLTVALILQFAWVTSSAWTF